MVTPKEFELTADRAASLSEILLRGVQREFPCYLATVLDSQDDLQLPKQLHPAFFGCFDWHSAVHSHWALAHLANLDLLPSTEALDVLTDHLREENLAKEVEYFERNKSFERPYGWAWFLTLAGELATGRTEEVRHLARNVVPLENLLVERFCQFLPRLSTPDRSGLHGNTAFSLGLIWDYTNRVGNTDCASVIEEVAKTLYRSEDHSGVAAEPGSFDFLSPSLVQADLMRRILLEQEFGPWFGHFFEGFDFSDLRPVQVKDHSDGQICHLDGLNLSRAWCLRNIAETLGKSSEHYQCLMKAAITHAHEGLAHVASGHYSGEHWLPTFATYLLRRPVHP